MTDALLVRPEAQADLADARNWYEQLSPGLDREFIEAVDDTLASIVRNPLAHPLVHRTVRRALTKRFPYGVFYLVETREIIILAVLHQARNPELWSRGA